jgi:cysteine desulfurase
MPAHAESAPVYLDYAATTPVDPRVAAEMMDCLTADGVFGNPSSATHAYGREARERVECARAEVAALLGAEPDRLVFTSGATEAANLALFGVLRAEAAGPRHLLTTRIEHRAVRDPARRLEREGCAVTWLEPDREGRIDPESVRRALRPETRLVSIILAHNEIGVIQDLMAISSICRAHGALLHTDAAQAVGKLPLDLGTLPVDLLSCTAHKLYGPKGVGALYVGPRARVQPLLYGGGQERGLRPGTLATHQIVGFGAAARLAREALGSEPERLARLRDRLWRRLAALPGVLRNGPERGGLPGLLNISVEGVEGESLVAALTDVAVSTGSACSSAQRDPSYVLRALGRSPALAESSLRLCVGRYTTEADVDRAALAIETAIVRLRALAPGDVAAGAAS